MTSGCVGVQIASPSPGLIPRRQLGNNRGNKYSKKHTTHNPSSAAFWDFSLDDFCLYDIPDSIEYVLNTTHRKTLSYVGFSQGTAQAFAALGVHPYLNERVNLFVALAPAMSPRGGFSMRLCIESLTLRGFLALRAGSTDRGRPHESLTDIGVSILRPQIHPFFYRHVAIDHLYVSFLLPLVHPFSTCADPPLFVSVIDGSLAWLFNWHGANITHLQKLAAYAHLFSFASVKSVVHWFQIMRSGEFLMWVPPPNALFL